MQNAVSGTIHKCFSWAEYLQSRAINVVLTIITFGTSYGVGNLTGLALVGTGLTHISIKTLATVAGAIAGTGIHTGSYCITRKVQDEPIETLQLVLEGMGGAVAGGLAGYLGARATLIRNTSIPIEQEILTFRNSDGAQIVVSNSSGLGNLQEGSIERLFVETVPQDAHDVLNSILQRFYNNPYQYCPLKGNRMTVQVFRGQILEE